MKRILEVSILIPNFNSGDLLGKSLKSIFSSTCPFSFEVLILDNLSNDNPEKYLDFYPNKPIRFFSQADDGVYDAMNFGVSQAYGQWLYFLGAGDEVLMENWFPLRLESHKRMIYGDVFLINKNKSYDGKFSLFKLMKKNICHQAIFYHHQIFEEIGYYDLQFKIVADYLYNLRVFLSAKDKITYYPIVISIFLGEGLSEKVRDHSFQNRKVRIISRLVFDHFSLCNFISFLQYLGCYFVAGVKNRLGWT